MRLDVRRTLVRLVLAAALAAGGARAMAAQGVPPLLIVTGAIPDPARGTLTITGQNFGPRPLVTLDLVPLALQSASETRIVAAVPITMMPAGEYLLTVARGPSAAEHASLEVALGSADSGRAGAKPGSPRARPGAAPAPDPPARQADAAAPAPQPLADPPDHTAAKVGDRVISVAEVDREWRQSDPAAYIRLSRQIHEMRRQVTDRLVADELLAREAAARGISVQALLDEEIPRRIVPMPDTAVVSLYQGLGENARGASLEQMRPALRAWLERVTEPELARMNYLEELMKVSTRAELFLEPPRVVVERSAQDAALGPESAPVELVVFGDLRSPEYARFAQAFGRVRETYGNRVRLVFKHLPMGPESLAAAEAALCAAAQEQFWRYHDALLAERGALSAPLMKKTAAAAGLAAATFDECLDSGRVRGLLQQALDEAGRYDIRISPSFLVNGRLTPEPPQFLPPGEFFTRVIEEELFRQSREAAAGR